jgi:hypothetical protein
MTLATKNGSIIVKGGKLAESCGCCEKCTCTTIESLSVAVHWGLSNQVIAYLQNGGFNVNNAIQPTFSTGQPRYPIGVINPFAQISESGTVYTVPRVPASAVPADIYGLGYGVQDRLGNCFYFYEDLFGGVTLTSSKFGPQPLGVQILLIVQYSQTIANRVSIFPKIRFAGQIIVNTENGDPYVDGFRWGSSSAVHAQGCGPFSTYVPYDRFNTTTLAFSYGAGAFPVWSAALTVSGVINPLP